MPQGFTYTAEDIVEILPDYNTGHTTIQAVAAPPGWEAFGGLQPEATLTTAMRATGAVSKPGLVMQLRLYRLTAPAGQVGPSVTISSEEVVSITTGTNFDLTGGIEYQVQAQVTGGILEEDFGVIHSVELI